MSYSTIATMADDAALMRRVTAAAAQEEKTKPYERWTYDWRWEVASSPGWAEAWESAVAAGNTNPGDDAAVITDGMILAAVQPLDEPVPPPAPVITSLSPATASITDADFEGHILGAGFTEDTVIIWNHAEEPTRFVDDGDVWTTVVPSVVTAPTVLDVYVRNGDGQVSNILPFTWTA